MLVRGRGVWRPARVHTPVPGPAERPQPRQLGPGLRFGARWSGLGLNVAVWRLGAFAAGHTWHHGEPASPASGAVEIEVEVPGTDGSRDPAELVLVRNRGAATRAFSASPGGTTPPAPPDYGGEPSPPYPPGPPDYGGESSLPGPAGPPGGGNHPSRAVFRARVPLSDLAGAGGVAARVGRGGG